MVVTTPPSRGIRSRKRKREAEEASSSADAVSEKNLKETAPMILARWKTAAYKGGSAARKLTEVLVEVEASTTPGKEEDFKPQKANAKRGSTSGQMWISGKNGSRLNTRTLGNKRPVTLLREVRRGTPLVLGGLPWRPQMNGELPERN